MGGWGGGGGGGVAKEKKQGPFMRPKRRFPKKDWKKTKKQKVFGMTASNGKVLAFLVGVGWGRGVGWRVGWGGECLDLPEFLYRMI